MVIVITRLTSMYAPQISMHLLLLQFKMMIQKDGLWKKYGFMLKRTHGYLKSSGWIKSMVINIIWNQKCFMQWSYTKQKLERYVRIKVPSYCSNTDVITNIHVTVNKINTEKCTIAVDSVKRFCPEDESINLGQKEQY